MKYALEKKNWFGYGALQWKKFSGQMPRSSLLREDNDLAESKKRSNSDWLGELVPYGLSMHLSRDFVVKSFWPQKHKTSFIEVSSPFSYYAMCS